MASKYTAKNITIADTRDAIYWNPNIITDTSKKLEAVRSIVTITLYLQENDVS